MKNFDLLGKSLVKTFLVILFITYTGSAFAVLVDMTGPTPEEASIIVALNKPADASKGLITLVAYDADFPDEGELIINGNKAIVLFGAAGAPGNDNDSKSASITFSTPAFYWRDGNNRLLFRHTNTQGFIINDVTVQFEVTPTDPPVTGDSFPLDLTGPTPEEASITVTVNKPADASQGLITLVAYDAEFPDEGELIINGNPAIALFGAADALGGDSQSANVTLSTPTSYWKDGNNTLLFRHTSTQGFIINDVTVQFEVNPTEPPVTGGSFPLNMTGSTPEEASVTITVNKPADASQGLITLVAFDAEFPDEGELIINGNKAIALFGAADALGGDSQSANVTLSTPASYWKDGNNTLLFRHTSTQGFIIIDVTVQFEVKPTDPPVTGGSFPLDMTGSTPEEASVTITVNKPADASQGLITLMAFDADFPDEGELVINGNPAIALFGAAGAAGNGNDSKSANITLSTPASYWRDGNNTLLFRHTSTQGFIIDDVTVKFEVNPAGNGSVNLNWVAPVERTDGTALALSEIAGYTVYYGTSLGNYTDSLSINDLSATSVTVTNLAAGTYYMVMTTRDVEGRESGYSSMVTKLSQ